MKKLSFVLLKPVFVMSIVFSSYISYSQTSKDTVKTGHANDPMNVNPGKVNDGMAVKPANPHDEMSIMSDTAFLTKNIKDNQMEIRLSKLGQMKGTSPEVKKVAGIMIADHTAILNDLTKLSSSKNGNNHQPDKSEMPSLPEGKEFDAAWAGEMLRMHEAKINELEHFISVSKDSALKAAVTKAIPKIKSHRELLQQIPGAKEKSKATQTI